MIYLKNATFIDWKTLEFKQNTNIAVEEGKGGRINFIDTIPNDVCVIDCSGQYVTKSFAVGHHHIYSALAAGMPAPRKIPTNFYEVLKYIWWTLDKSLTKEMIEYSALATAIYAAKAGNTFIIDHHASPNAIEGSLEIIASALDRAGLSHLLCYEITDRDGEDKALAAVDETDSYLSKHQGLVGLHASFTVGQKTMKAAADLMQKHKAGFHIHVAEDKLDEDLCTIDHSMRVVERLDYYGALDYSSTILGHAIHVNDREREILRNSKAWIAQNPESNMNNNVGFFSLRGLDPDRVMLGTDGMHSDMIRSAQMAYFAGVPHEAQDFETIYKRFRNVHNYLSQNGFDGDADNNLVVLDYKPRTEFNADNFLGHFFFAMSSSDVKHVISDGNVIVRDGKMITIDEDAVLAQARELSSVLWKKMSSV